jgi:hypothetical protein
MRSFPFDVKAEDARAALRVGVSVGLPLLVMVLADQIQFAVYAAFGALTSLYGHNERAGRRIETQAVAGAALVVTLACAVVYATTHAPFWLLPLMLAGAVVGAGTLGTIMGWVPRGEMFFILVLLVVAGIPLSPDELASAIGAGLAGAVFSIVLSVLEPGGAVDARGLPGSVRSRAHTGAASLDRRRHAIVIAIAAIAVCGAWLAAGALKIGHPFWAPIAAAALMPAISPADAISRTVKLLAGTIGGAALASLLFAAGPGPIALVVIIALCQAIAELFMARSYAVALLFITPLAIGMSNLGRNQTWSPLLIERVMEAGLGAVVALAAIIVGSAILARLAMPAASRGA